MMWPVNAGQLKREVRDTHDEVRTEDQPEAAADEAQTAAAPQADQEGMEGVVKTGTERHESGQNRTAPGRARAAT
jgi:hypothetical protein